MWHHDRNVSRNWNGRGRHDYGLAPTLRYVGSDAQAAELKAKSRRCGPTQYRETGSGGVRACPNTQMLFCRSETVVVRETLLSLGVSWQVKAKLDYSRSWNASPLARQIERVVVEVGEW